MSRRCFIAVAWLLLTLETAVASAETLPPGRYSCQGQVVEQAGGQISVFWGNGCYNFPQKLQAKLKEHLGKFVKVDYIRVSDDQAGVVSLQGSAIGSIEQVTALADSHDKLPVRVDVTPAAKSFTLTTPVGMRVKVTNQSGQRQSLHLYASYGSLCQDYMSKLTLADENHYYDKRPYGNPQLRRLHDLQAGEEISFDIESRRMAEPGTYQLLYVLTLGAGDQRLHSNVVEVEVLPAATAAEKQRALKHWLHRASTGQRVDIASRLVADGDNSAKREVLSLLRPRDHSQPPYLSSNAYAFAWKHGGEEGEAAMLDLIRAQKRQDRVIRMVEQVQKSPNRVAVLLELLDSKQETYRDIAGWVDHPRVCDIVASWLAGYTHNRIKFPRDGSEQQRDTVVEQVRRQLRESPEFFDVLKPTYR